MCAKDRSQITVLSQTETIHSFSEMLNFSSCPSFIRNTQGEFLHTSPLFDKIFLTSVTSVAWFSALPLKTKIELIQSEIKSFTEDSSVLVRGIGFGDISWTVFIESFHLDDEKYSRWVFIREGEAICDHAKEYADFSSKMEKYIDRISKTASSDWAIFNLYSVGFSHATISKITGVKEQTSRNAVRHIKNDLNFPDRDYIILSSICALSYGRIVGNVIEILKGDVNFLLIQ